MFPERQEIERTVLMEVFAVDVGTEGPDGVGVTAASRSREGAGDSPGKEPEVLSAQADTVEAACTKIQTYGDEYVFYGDVEEVVVGEGAARRGLENLLSHLARNPELRLEAQLWVMRGGSAADALFGGVEGEGGGVPTRLQALERDSKRLAAPESRTARVVLSDLLSNGCTLLPALELRPAGVGEGAKGDTTLAASGYAVIREGALCGYLGEEDTFGADLLKGRGIGRVLELETPEPVRVALELTGVKTRLKPVFRGDRLTGLQVKCALEAQAIEVQSQDCKLKEDDRAWLEKELTRVAEVRLRQAMKRFQSLEADCPHLGERAALTVPWKKAALEEQWETAFPELKVTWDVSAEVARE